jgi:protein CpxP
MTHTPKHLVVAGLLAVLGLSANAQTPPAAPGSGPGQMMREGHSHGGPGHMMREGYGQGDPARMQERMNRMQERMTARLTAIKQKLQLSPGQEAAWNNYIAALQPANKMKRPDRAELEKLTTPERIDRMRALRAERMTEMDKRADATKTFYASLTPDQKKLFDTETAHRGRRGGFGGGHHGHHHGA